MSTLFTILTIITWTATVVMFKYANDTVQCEEFHSVFTYTRLSAIILTIITIMLAL